MGLLDDAIREHLELKRRRGADPGEVAREQHEALDPVELERAPLEEGGHALAGEPAQDAGESLETLEPELGAPAAAGGPEAAPAAFAEAPPTPAHETVTAGAGETAELDMRTVLGDDVAASDELATPGVAGGVRPAPVAGAPLRDDAPSDGDSLEWEMPGSEDASEEPELDAEESPEDVLEETPDFLRDTPEQDRLWFEQRPPRDFDFDK